MTISGPEDQRNFDKVVAKKEKQDRSFITIAAHPTTSDPKNMKAKEMWISATGSPLVVKLNYRGTDGKIYGITLPEQP